MQKPRKMFKIDVKLLRKKKPTTTTRNCIKKAPLEREVFLLVELGLLVIEKAKKVSRKSSFSNRKVWFRCQRISPTRKKTTYSIGMNWEQKGITLTLASMDLYSSKTSGKTTPFLRQDLYLKTLTPSLAASVATGSSRLFLSGMVKPRTTACPLVLTFI